MVDVRRDLKRGLPGTRVLQDKTNVHLFPDESEQSNKGKKGDQSNQSRRSKQAKHATQSKQASKFLRLSTSVPELVNRTISTEGTASMTILARVFSWREGAPKEVPFSRVSCTKRIHESRETGSTRTSWYHFAQKQSGTVICAQNKTAVRDFYVFLASITRHCAWD